MLAVIHANPKQAHQVRQAFEFAYGLDRLGISRSITADIEQAGDIHICLGPNYALNRWQRHPRVILLDRCFYGGETTHITLGWARPEGGRRFPPGDDSRWRRSGQTLGDLRPSGDAALLLGDYHEDRHAYARNIVDLHSSHRTVRYRPHPVHPEPWPACPVQRLGADTSLEDALNCHDTAAGYLTSALVIAGLRGLHLIALHAGSAAAGWRADNRQAWANSVAWANWAEPEIGTGAAIEWLLASEENTAAERPC